MNVSWVTETVKEAERAMMMAKDGAETGAKRAALEATLPAHLFIARGLVDCPDALSRLTNWRWPNSPSLTHYQEEDFEETKQLEDVSQETVNRLRKYIRAQESTSDLRSPSQSQGTPSPSPAPSVRDPAPSSSPASSSSSSSSSSDSTDSSIPRPTKAPWPAFLDLLPDPPDSFFVSVKVHSTRLFVLRRRARGKCGAG